MSAKLLAGLLLTQVATWAGLPAAWQHWQYTRPIELAPEERPKLVGVVVPLEVYRRSHPALADLRVMDDTGSEVPFVLRARPGHYTQAIVDTGDELAPHNSLQLETAEENFFAWVEVAVSDDARRWRILRERAPIYRFQQEGLGGNQVVSYSETRARFLRLRISDGEERFSLRRCRVARAEVEEAERAAVPVRLETDLAAPAHQNWWWVDLEADTFPVSEVRFAVAQSEFHRAVEVRSSHDAETWDRVGAGAIHRTARPTGDRTQESLQVEFEETRRRYWRVVVLNRNDPPLAGLRPQLYATPRRVLFRPEQGRRYRLLYGNSRAQAPNYEMARLTDRKELDRAAPAALGPEEMNPGYVDPRPWSERHPLVLWVALGIAVAVLALLAVRSLRS